jgi:hypothetical protein
MHLLTLTWHYVVLHKTALLELAGGGAGLSVALQVVLHKLKVDSKKVAYALIHLFTLLTALSTYYLDNKNVLPVYAGLVIFAQTWHRFAVDPAYKRYVLPFLDWLTVQKTGGSPAIVAAEATADVPSSFA